MKKDMTYSEAVKRLEQLTASIEQGQLDIDKLSEALKEARLLLDFCKEKLGAAEQDVNKILQTDGQE